MKVDRKKKKRQVNKLRQSREKEQRKAKKKKRDDAFLFFFVCVGRGWGELDTFLFNLNLSAIARLCVPLDWLVRKTILPFHAQAANRFLCSLVFPPK